MTTEKPVADDPKIEKHVGEEFPKLLYKLEPLPPDPPPPPKFRIATKVVHDKDEEGKASGDGWLKDVPKIPEDKPAPGAHPAEHNDKKK